MASSVGQGRTVLVLDDDDALRGSITRILEMAGHEVLPAENAHAALAILETHPEPIDLLLCDLVLPGLAGREAASVILARRPEIKVLFTSGYSGSDPARRELTEGGEAFIAKPFDVPELLAAVDSAIGPGSTGHDQV